MSRESRASRLHAAEAEAEDMGMPGVARRAPARWVATLSPEEAERAAAEAARKERAWAAGSD